MFDEFDAAAWFSVKTYYNSSSGGHEGLYKKYWQSIQYPCSC